MGVGGVGDVWGWGGGQARRYGRHSFKVVHRGSEGTGGGRQGGGRDGSGRGRARTGGRNRGGDGEEDEAG